MDLEQPIEEEEQGTQEITDKKYWENRSSKKSMALLERIVDMVKKIAEPPIPYNKSHIAFGTFGRNFL